MNLDSDKIHLTIFASGSGSNAENLMKYFQNHPAIKIEYVISDKASAGAIEKAKQYHVHSKILDASYLNDDEKLLAFLKSTKTDVIILAGYLKLIPKNITEFYPNKIINIHPALLPKFGGKGMYGKKVHQKVFESGESESGITIHLVNEKYDEGAVLFQEKFPILNTDTPKSIEKKVRQLELKNFPHQVEKYVLSFK